jgi:hypothetical protein
VCGLLLKVAGCRRPSALKPLGRPRQLDARGCKSMRAYRVIGAVVVDSMRDFPLFRPHRASFLLMEGIRSPYAHSVAPFLV